MNFADLSPDTLRWIYRMAAVALLMFWMVGAYNRLMRHRNALATAWGQIDELLTRRVAALEPLIAQLHEPMVAEANTLQALQQALLANLPTQAAGSTPLAGSGAAANLLSQSALEQLMLPGRPDTPPGRDFNPLDLLLLLRTARYRITYPISATRTAKTQNKNHT